MAAPTWQIIIVNRIEKIMNIRQNFKNKYFLCINWCLLLCNPHYNYVTWAVSITGARNAGNFIADDNGLQI